MSRNTYIAIIFVGLLFLFAACNETRPKPAEEVSTTTQPTINTTKVDKVIGAKDTSKTGLKKYATRYYSIDSIEINGFLFRLKQQQDADSKTGYFLLECFERQNKQWEKQQEWKLYGYYDGMTKRDYNKDNYADLCVRIQVLGPDTISLENKHTLLMYRHNKKSFERLTNCWDTTDVVRELEEGLKCCPIFGTKGEEYELKRGLGYFCSPATYAGYEPILWTSCLWKVEGMEIKIYGHIELMEQMLYYYPANAIAPSDSLKLKNDYNLDDLNKIMKDYWTQNRSAVLPRK